MLERHPRLATDHHGVPYSLTEEFVAVYRMHPLLPDDFTFRSHRERTSVLQERTFREIGVNDVARPARRARLRRLALLVRDRASGCDHAAQLPALSPGAASGRTATSIDLAAIDVLRVRERGVPRYNEFRRLFHLKPAATFEELTDDPERAEELREVYGDIEQVDLMVGLYAEPLPQGFGFSDTAFRIFILMASRRLKSDRFFTRDFTPRSTRRPGSTGSNETSMSDVLLRHYPELEPALRGRRERVRALEAGERVIEIAPGVHVLGGTKGGHVRSFLLETTAS